MTTHDAVGLSKPDLQCDLIMKGGITSGVVFPKAITRLAGALSLHEYRWHLCGIDSCRNGCRCRIPSPAGQTDVEKRAGFATIDDMAEDLARNLKTLFQPSPQTRPLFLFLQ
ncbi:hypothetical protein ACFSKM_01810 [Ancylobacter dichloromethanicus]